MGTQRAQEVGHYTNGLSLLLKIQPRALQDFFALHLMSLVMIGHHVIFC